MQKLRGAYWRLVYVLMALAALAAAAGAPNSWDGGGP